MKMRTRQRHLNYHCLYNHQLSLMFESAFAEFKETVNEQGGSLNNSLESVRRLAGIYRHFKNLAMRFAIAR